MTEKEIGGTSLNKEEFQCIGCGAVIQTENPSEAGYLPASALAKGMDDGNFYCQRCFRLRHYNELQDLTIDDDVFLEKLSAISEDEDALIINVVDIFDVEGSLINGLRRFVGNQPIVVAANKFDLLPKVTKENRVKHWLKQVLHQNGLQAEDVFLISANKKHTLEPLIELIKKAVLSKNIYIVGVTNVGKSTLINQLIAYFGGEKEIITTSNHPGTTLDMIRIPLTEEHAIVDTPGIVHRTQLAHYLNRDEIKTLLPTKPLKPMTFQLNPDQTIFIGAAARVDFTRGKRASFTYYVSKDATLHRTKTEGAEEFYLKHRGELLSPPFKETLENFPELVSRTIQLKPDYDVAISGLGWFTVNEPVEIVIWTPKGVALSIREAII